MPEYENNFLHPANLFRSSEKQTVLVEYWFKAGYATVNYILHHPYTPVLTVYL